MPIVDDIAALAAGPYTAAWEGQHASAPQEAFEPIIIEVHPEAMTNQPRRHRVRYFPDTDHTRRSDDHTGFAEVDRAPFWQGHECCTVCGNCTLSGYIAGRNKLIDKFLIGRPAIKVPASAQHQSLSERRLEVPMGALN